MEEAPENGQESLHSAHANGMNELHLPPPLPQVSGLAVPAAHCGCAMMRGLLAVLA